jgi:hypothetical protein
MSLIGRQAYGIKAPIIRQGDDICEILIDCLSKIEDEDHISVDDGDIIGITESVVARAQGNYVTVDDIAAETKRIFGENAYIVVDSPIYSRNRFSMILKGIARGASGICLLMPNFDEVGNPRGINPFTGVDIEEYYKEIVESEGAECFVIHKSGDEILYEDQFMDYIPDNYLRYVNSWLNCRLHNPNIMYGWVGETNVATLEFYFPDKCKWGLLGSNKANEETLKLFPNDVQAKELVYNIKDAVKRNFNADVDVIIYGDGCFHSPEIPGVEGSSIWEFADPVTMPGYTDKELIESTPNEIKLKAFIDEGYTEGEIQNLINGKKDLKGSMSSQGTTPRLYRDLLASLMDLTSGSGDRATPIILIQNYFRD